MKLIVFFSAKITTVVNNPPLFAHFAGFVPGKSKL